MSPSLSVFDVAWWLFLLGCLQVFYNLVGTPWWLILLGSGLYLLVGPGGILLTRTLRARRIRRLEAEIAAASEAPLD